MTSVYKPEDVEIKICSNDNNIVEGIFFCLKNIINKGNVINKIIGVDSTFNGKKNIHYYFSPLNKFWCSSRRVPKRSALLRL